MPRPRHEPDGVAPDVFTGIGRAKGAHIKDVLAALVQRSRDGSLLPSERVLAERFGVARMTVRGAIDDLVARGLVRRVSGRGTFVRRPTLTHSEIFRSFSEDMHDRGMTPGSRDYRARTRPATRDVADRLGVEPGTPVHSIERVRTADGVPMALERTNLPAERFAQLLTVMNRDESLYAVLARVFGVRLESAEQTVSIARLRPAEARRLEVPEDEAAFLIERVSLDAMGNVVEFGRSLYRGDRYAIQMQVSRPAGT
ncbi:GntR family transcriptional regulator [Jiangella alkaliphila]|uniref:GntR family transcriptional regulator n=1 Tax=Jiangella alkaliphila TaxID=419479 RepID=A0A1H2LJK1_9ACTN|nr:GntR family transcriptional regulator [Jiangella alkaliphila]SDU80808.1 GntR family transcriptional regulator [Jiangella alkaliphila]